MRTTPPHCGPKPAETTAFVILGILVGAAYAFALTGSGWSVLPRTVDLRDPAPVWRPLATGDRTPGSAHAPTAARLGGLLAARNLDLAAVRSGDRVVPAVRVAAVPSDLADVADVQTRKDLFFGMTLPLVLAANDEVRADRQRLARLGMIRDLGQPLPPPDLRWLHTMADRYGLHDPAGGPWPAPTALVAGLLAHVDTVPAGLALAQAAEESGWATSRFAREGNALFGQWAWDGSGMVPEDRATGDRHRVRAFANPLESVRAYLFNLNAHRAYAGFRARRAELRAAGDVPGTSDLVGTLTSYSERGAAYVRTLRTIIRANDLEAFDRARLAQPVIAAR